ncbi:MAG: hypothetical protein HDQ93_06910 [Desulfovibrio sp.]|nr:hypothetical protein [Desulfovibrio sp.]
MLDINRLSQRYAALKDERSGWDEVWRAISELFLPDRFRDDRDDTAYRRPRISSRLVNSCGVLALRTLAAGMQGGMTSPARPWFRLKLKSEEEAEGANAWLDETTTRMQSILHESNFYNAVHGLYADLGAFGTGLLIETADENGIVFHLARPGEYVIDVNGDNEVDTFFRRIRMTARQMVDRFGENACPEYVKTASAMTAAQNSRFNVIHGVFPRKDIDRTAKIGAKSMPFASVYWLEGGASQGRGHILSKGGFAGFPAFAPRWDVNGGDIYGRSPAMDALPDCRMLQAMTSSLRKMQHKMTDPPLVADASLKPYGVDDRPGAINFADAGAILKNGAIQPIQQPQPTALQFTMQAIQDVENVVREGLYSNLFRMLLDEDRKQITATEIQAKLQEKMILIGPVVERLHKELLEPLIVRTFELMRQYQALPPLPEGIQGGELDVTFESVLAQAQKLTATSAIDQGWAFVLQTAQADPNVLDMVNRDAMIRSYLERTGMPESCVNDEEAIAKIREERARAGRGASPAGTGGAT